MPRIMLLLPTATYRAPDFVRAAATLGVEVVVASEEAQALAAEMGDRALVVPFTDPERAAEVIVEAARARPVDAVVAVDEPGVVPAAIAAERLGLSHNPPGAVMATRDKVLLRERLAAAGIPQPRFAVAAPGDDVAALAREVGLPCVVKPVSLSAGRGVIRADTGEEAAGAAARVREILRRADTGDVDDAGDGPLLVEEYVPGAEVALEGLLTGGHLDVLAIFDKPDPMEGPYFAETLLVTPSRLPAAVQEEVRRVTAAATQAIGLVEGPVHAEARVAGEGPSGPSERETERVWFLELAARSIGGLCSRALRFGVDAGLEELILRQALGMPVPDLSLADGAAGVAMLYAPEAGVLEAVTGVEEAAGVPGIEGIDVTARPGSRVAPLPDDARYLGFVFARGRDPVEVEEALREAVARIGIVVTTP